jgi:hypothetical protein
MGGREGLEYRLTAGPWIFWWVRLVSHAWVEEISTACVTLTAGSATGPQPHTWAEFWTRPLHETPNQVWQWRIFLWRMAP